MPAEAPGQASAIAERRHIFIVTETYPPEVNGVALTLSNLVKGLISRGHKVSMVRPRQRQADCRDRGCDPAVTLVRGLPCRATRASSSACRPANYYGVRGPATVRTQCMSRPKARSDGRRPGSRIC